MCSLPTKSFKSFKYATVKQSLSTSTFDLTFTLEIAEKYKNYQILHKISTKILTNLSDIKTEKHPDIKTAQLGLYKQYLLIL